MKKLLFFIFIPVFLNAGREQLKFPIAPAIQKECESQKRLNRILSRLYSNQEQNQNLVKELAKATRANNFETMRELLDALVVRRALEETMLLQARIVCGEIEQEQGFFNKRWPTENGLDVPEIHV